MATINKILVNNQTYDIEDQSAIRKSENDIYPINGTLDIKNSNININTEGRTSNVGGNGKLIFSDAQGNQIAYVRPFVFSDTGQGAANKVQMIQIGMGSSGNPSIGIGRIGTDNATAYIYLTNTVKNAFKTALALGTLADKDSIDDADISSVGASKITGAISAAHGGTGRTTLTKNAVLTGNTTSAVNMIATASGALYATAANGAPAFGTLPVAQGGTGATTLTSGAVLIGNGTSAITTRAIINNTSHGELGYTTTNKTYIPTLNTLAYFNGAYKKDSNGYHSNIEYVGTIKGGTWNGSAIPIKYGGTGATSASAAWTALGGGAIGKKATLDPADIPSLNASKINSGIFSAARLPSASTSAQGAMSAADKIKLDRFITEDRAAKSGGGLNVKFIAPNKSWLMFTYNPSNGNVAVSGSSHTTVTVFKTLT